MVLLLLLGSEAWRFHVHPCWGGEMLFDIILRCGRFQLQGSNMPKPGSSKMRGNSWRQLRGSWQEVVEMGYEREPHPLGDFYLGWTMTEEWMLQGQGFSLPPSIPPSYFAAS